MKKLKLLKFIEIQIQTKEPHWTIQIFKNNKLFNEENIIFFINNIKKNFNNFIQFEKNKFMNYFH